MAWNPFRFFSTKSDKGIENRTRKFFKALAGFTTFYRKELHMGEYRRRFQTFVQSIEQGDKELTKRQLQDILSRVNAITEACIAIIRYNLIVMRRKQKDMQDVLDRQKKVGGIHDIQQGKRELEQALAHAASQVQDTRVLIRQKAQDIRSVFRSFSTTSTRRSAIDAMKDALNAKSEVREQSHLIGQLNGAIHDLLTNKNEQQRSQIIVKISGLLQNLAANYEEVIHLLASQTRDATLIIDFVNGEIAELYRYVALPAGPGDRGGILCQKGMPTDAVQPFERMVTAVDQEKNKQLLQLAASSDIIARQAARIAA